MFLQQIPLSLEKLLLINQNQSSDKSLASWFVHLGASQYFYTGHAPAGSGMTAHESQPDDRPFTLKNDRHHQKVPGSRRQ